MADGAALRWAAVALMAGGLGASGCGKRAMAVNEPAKVCASAATTERLRAALFQKAQAAAGSSNRYAIPKLQPQSTVSLSRPLVESYDPATRRTNCTGLLSVSLPAGVMAVGALRTPVRYSAQPLADGSGVDFELSGADELVATIAGADLTAWAKVNGTAAPGLVVEVATAPGELKLAQETPAQRPTTAKAGRSPAPQAPAAPLPPAPPAKAPAPTPAPVLAKAVPAPAPKLAPRPSPAAAPTRRPEPPPPVMATRASPPAAPRSRPIVAEGGPRRPAHSAAPEPSVFASREPAYPRLRPAAPLPPEPPRYADGPVRVFVHVPAGAGRGEADAVRDRLGDLVLRGAPVGTPAVRRVARTPGRNEVRCLKRSDCAAARQVAAYLARSLPGGVTVVDMSRTYEDDPGVRPGSLELWLSPGPSRPPPPPGYEDDEEE